MVVGSVQSIRNIFPSSLESVLVNLVGAKPGTAVTEGFYIVKKYVQHSHEPQMPRKNKFTDDV